MPSDKANYLFCDLFRFLCGFLCALYCLLRPFAALCRSVLLLDSLLLPIAGYGVGVALQVVANTLFVQGIHIGLIQFLFCLVKLLLRFELMGMVSGFTHADGSLRCSLRSMSCLYASILILGFPNVPMHFLRNQPARCFLYLMGKLRWWLGCFAFKFQTRFLLYLLYTVSRFLRFLNGLF